MERKSGTMAEQLLEVHATRGTVFPGEIVECAIDLLMMHEMLGDQVSRVFRESGIKKIWDPDKVVTVLDHWVPASSVEVAMIHQEYREFVREHQLPNDLGMATGVCHVTVPEHGFVKPGMLVIGTDSHTTTYGALNCFATGMGATDAVIILATGKNWFKVPSSVHHELAGTLKGWACGKDVALSLLSIHGTSAMSYKSMEFSVKEPGAFPMADRFTVANMAVEMGAKCAIFDHDVVTETWLEANSVDGGRPARAHPEAIYDEEHEIGLDEIEPLVALPHSPANVKPVSEASPVEIDQVFMGSCTNGRFEDLETAAKVLGRNEIHPRVRCIVVPASRKVYLQALEAGLIERFIKAGCIVEHPNCGPCMGAHQGILGPGETCVSTSNRNFPGRMGSSEASIYLASPAVAMASAVAGHLAAP